MLHLKVKLGCKDVPYFPNSTLACVFSDRIQCIYMEAGCIQLKQKNNNR